MISKKLKIAGISVLIIFFYTAFLYSYPSGYTGRTLKTTTQGCGSCHSFNTSVTGSISGPDTVIAGQTVQYTITVNDPNRSKAGMDIAVKFGVLAPGNGSAYIKLVGDELTQKSSLSMTNHTISVQFNYTAPTAAGIDTIFSTVTSGTPAWNWSPGKRVVVSGLTGIVNNGIPAEFRLEQNYPNPFNPSTTISFSLPRESNVRITVYNIAGNSIATLVNGKLNAGLQSVTWNASGFASGVYFYKLESEGLTFTRKMILAK